MISAVPPPPHPLARAFTIVMRGLGDLKLPRAASASRHAFQTDDQQQQTSARGIARRGGVTAARWRSDHARCLNNDLRPWRIRKAPATKGGLHEANIHPGSGTSPHWHETDTRRHILQRKVLAGGMREGRDKKTTDSHWHRMWLLTAASRRCAARKHTVNESIIPQLVGCPRVVLSPRVRGTLLWVWRRVRDLGAKP